jgi:hypothetical protein
VTSSTCESSPYECRQQERGALPPDECRGPCILAVMMTGAHQAWRATLAATIVADILATLPPATPLHARSRLMGLPDQSVV